MAISTYTPSNKIVHRVKKDLASNRQISKPIHLVQGDCGLPVVAVELYSSILNIISAAATSEITVRCRDNDRNTVISPALGINSTGDVIFFEITKEMTQSAGCSEVVVSVKCDGAVVQSSIVTLEVDRNPIQEEVE